MERVVGERTRVALRALGTALLWLAGSTAGAAQETRVDPAAVEIVRAGVGPISQAQDLEVRVRTLYDVVQEDGQKLQFGSRDTIRLRRPDRAAYSTLRDDGEEREVRYDGALLSIYDRNENAYGQFPVPATLDATFDYLELELGMPLPLADFLYNDLSHLSGVATEGAVIGTSRVGEWDCDHVAFRGEGIDWQLWIEREGARRLRKLVVTYSGLPGEPQFLAIFDRWQLDAKSADEAFVFTPPEGAQRIPVLARPVDARIEGVR